MQNRLWVAFIISALFTITVCSQTLAQPTQGTTGEQPVPPQVNTEPTPQPQTQPGAEPAPQAQPQPSAEPAPQPQPSTAPASQPPLVPLAQPECFPKCRAGYMCQQGQCVSLCNPPCASNETCTENGACITKEAAPQQAVYQEEDSELRYRHTGFFLRFTVGLGWSNAEAPYEIENSGFSSFGGFDIGGAVTENLILHARISGLMNNAYKEVTIDLDPDPIETKAETISYGLFGGGLTYYFMPANIYMTFILGLAGVGYSVDEDGVELTEDGEEDYDLDRDELEQAELGIGFNLDLGKEWWVGSEWGLGIAGRFSYSSVSPDDDAESDDWLKCIGLGVLFTATYN